ncbi:alpha/beta fold hydrolase [Rhodospirillaceae bacterium SYSU D60014]|uniref:alpha/beta fold hydrolase n=1 Tax=Virgifigura deserti TaxID=2268457 RepID=UPI000E675E9D
MPVLKTGHGRTVHAMSGSPEIEINEALYQWCVRAFSLLRHRLGINIRVHDADGHIKAGQIFLFNHFARFETIIPQYFIYQATGAYCRCVATHELFLGNDRFAKFLWNCGAVPSNHPGLLPFLAAEILRGRKIIIFPEGGMIKDRNVLDEAEFSILSPMARTTRKHRRGAAALAVILETYKKRILSVFEAGDTQRLDRWVQALGLADIDSLIAAARQPTLIVPSNITFYPIHTSDNILRKAAELFGQDIGEQLKEELLIEGNLLLKRTDMDIRFGKPIHPHVTWNPADRLILSQAFERIDSLEDLFALKDTASRWIERIVATTMQRKMRRLRDLCMQEMYARVTVNLNHLASRLILSLVNRGTMEIERDRFHRLLYLAFKNAQKEPLIHLHQSLADPETYDGIHDGTSRLVTQLMEGAIASGLIVATSDHYRFLPALRQENGGRDPRIENVIVVYANEIAPVSAACRAVDRAIRAEAAIDGGPLARLLFDDEVRAYARCKETYSRPQYAAINDQETATESGEPYLLVPNRPKDLGVVLVHGFLASPAELKAFGQRLAALGHPVIGVRLKGHGTSPWDLRERTWQDWLESVRRGYEIMSHLSDRVCLVGFSTGGSLALLLAADKPRGLAGVAAVSPALRFRNRNLIFVPVIHHINRLTEWAYVQEGVMPFRINESEHPETNYRHMPIRGLFELRRTTEELERRLPQVVCPTEILQGTEDPVIDPESATLIHDKIGSVKKSLHMIPSQRHGILNENVGSTQALIISFLDTLSPTVARSTSFKAVLSAAPMGVAASLNFSGGGSIMINVGDAISRSLRPFLSRFRRGGPGEAPPLKRPYPWERSYPKDLDWQINIDPKPVPALLDEAVKTYADRTCISFRGRHYRYREVGRLVDKAAKGFQALGVRRGIKVGLMLPNCPYAVICYYAVLKAGGTVVNINPLYSGYEIERQLADSDSRILVTLDVNALYEKVAGLVREDGHIEKLVVCRMRGVLRFTEKILFDFFKSREMASFSDDERHVSFERLIDNDGAVKPSAIDPVTDIAVLQYTGGTTGFPKGAQLTHANLFVNTAQLALWAPDVKRGEEKSLAVLPLFHSFGMTAVMNLSLWIGAEIILLAKFETAEVLDAINREKPTVFIGVPTMFSALTAARDVAKHDLSSLKFCISGGAPLPSELQRRFEALSGCTLVEGYGLSEAGPVCTVNPLTGGKPGSVGLPLPGTVIEIVSMEDPDRTLEIGERGEICVTGPQVMAGYANRAKESVDILQGARLHTGDVGYLDEDGYLYIVDRIKDLILSGGFNVYPRQVEEVIYLHPAVEEAAVCGVPDLHRGEIVKAFIKLREGASVTAAELRAFLRDKLAPFQMPRQIEFRDELPKTLIGKISKKDLVAEAATANTEQGPALTVEA